VENVEQPIRREVAVEASIDDVWAALTTEDQLGDWFGADVQLQARRDGPVTFRMADGSTRRGIVEAVDPPTRFAFRWRSVEMRSGAVQVGDVSRVEFLLEAIDDHATRVTVVESPGMLAPDARLSATA
jgi:uncharacterized protein YndB with AHSA1/START domain